MKLVFVLELFFGLMGLSRSQCVLEAEYFCSAIPNDYPENLKSILFVQKNVGVINSTVFRSPNLKSVISLTLANSGITRIEPGAFYAFQGLTKLGLYDNRLTWFSPSWLSNPALLNNLSISGNDLQEIKPSMLSGFSNLTMLNLTRNKIQRVTHGSFSNLPMETFIDLSDNNISTLSINIFGCLKHPKMKLGGNPWNCSCELQDFGIFLQELLNASLLVDAEHVTCHSPSELAGITVWNVSDFNCSAFISISPSLENKFGKIGLPTVLTCLVVVSFLALFFLFLKKKQDKKQVQPDKERSGLQISSAKGKGSAINSASKTTTRRREWAGDRQEMDGKSKVKALKGRSKSAAAVLVKSEFVQIDTRRHMPKADIQKVSQGRFALNERSCQQGLDSDNATALWCLNSLQDIYKRASGNHAEHLALIKTGYLSHDPTAQLKESNQRPATPGTCWPDGPKESPKTENFEPLLYLSVLTDRENPHVTEDVEKDSVPRNTNVKPLSFRKVLTWPPAKGTLDQTQRPILSFKDFLNAQLLLSNDLSSSYLANRSSDLEEGAKTCGLDLSTLRKPLPTEHDHTGKTDVERAQDEQIRLPKKKANPKKGMKDASPSFEKKMLKGSRGPKSKQNGHHTPKDLTQENEMQLQTSRDRSAQASSPADDGLLENNEYNFIDLLHEVVENHGRWTRERWKQTHQHRPVNQSSLTADFI